MQSQIMQSDNTRIANRVHGVNAFSPFVSLSLNPVAVEICEQSIDIVSSCSVSIPLLSVVAEECLILQGVRILCKP